MAVEADFMFPACNKCEHLLRGTVACAAFPKGIPREILSGENTHKKPYPGDNGIMFSPDGD